MVNESGLQLLKMQALRIKQQEGESMEHSQFFSSDYTQARQKFVAAALAAGLTHEAFVHPSQRGPHGEGLFIDVARQGPAQASTVLLTSSAVHGIEGFAGSAGQIATLSTGLLKQLPPDTAVVHVHALNPYGFAHQRRVNEDNVDLNRNFIDWQAPRPAEHPHTETLYRLLLPDDWSGELHAKSSAQIDAFISQHGVKTYQAAITQGQYRFADGLYYGGTEPVWSHRIWRQILDRHVKGARQLVHVDLHTGLGPYGYGELIFSEPKDSAAYRRAHAWWGDSVTCTLEGTSTSAVLSGDIEQSFKTGLPGTEVTSVTLEFGTVAIREVLESLIADNWLHIKGQMGTPLAAQIKRQLRYCFYGEEPVWQSMIVGRVMQVLEQARDGLAQGI
jgi:hypothetical protein